MSKRFKVSASEKTRAVEWPKFMAEVEARLNAGAREYGDKSFSASPKKLISEIQQEIYDIVGWSFILSCRLARVAGTLDDLAGTCRRKAAEDRVSK